MKKWHFLDIFSTKMRHIFAVVLATSIKGGSKWNMIIIFDKFGNFQISVSRGAEISGYELGIGCIKPIYTWYKRLDFSSLYGWILLNMILNDVLQNFTAIHGSLEAILGRTKLSTKTKTGDGWGMVPGVPNKFQSNPICFFPPRSFRKFIFFCVCQL